MFLSCFWSEYSAVLSPVSTSLNEMIPLRYELLMKGTSQDSYTLICRAVAKVSAGNANLCTFAFQLSVIIEVFPFLPVLHD